MAGIAIRRLPCNELQKALLPLQEALQPVLQHRFPFSEGAMAMHYVQLDGSGIAGVVKGVVVEVDKLLQGLQPFVPVQVQTSDAIFPFLQILSSLRRYPLEFSVGAGRDDSNKAITSSLPHVLKLTAIL